MDVLWMMEFTRRITKAYASCCEPICREFHISRTSFDILLFLANHPGLYTAKDVSRCRNLKPNVVSIHVEQLAGSGYLLRQAVPGDRRKVKLLCTPKAEPILQRGRQMQKQFHALLTEGICEEDMNSFKHCILSIMENAEHIPDKNGL